MDGRRRASCSEREAVDQALDVLVGETLENFVGVSGLDGGFRRRLCLNDAIRGGDGNGDVERMTGARRVTGDAVRLRRGVDISCVNREQ